ncbi:hypothetical protein P0136_08095 [Lentisphaerota bacterium ZTH]|nr:hypothetical protein JYG24_00795 [Lentisphaerota bacterium]WET05324.1 hypothetical protein P0136_08095 [Lentisphaerota bacterium ZTH]
MKKKILLAIIFISQLLTFQVLAQPRRCDDAVDTSSTSNYVDAVQYARQWSFYPYWSVSNPVNWRYAFIPEVPAIGQYTDEEYLYRQKILIINASSDMLELAPRNMRQSIIPGVTQFQNIGEIMAIANLRCFVTAVITGKGSHPDDETLVGKEFNISYHGLLSEKNAEAQENADPPEEVNFARDIPVGMFVAKGVLAASDETFPMERFASIHVSCHQDENNENIFRCSPNNARFVPIAEVSSFWTVAKIGDYGENIYVTYHLLCNTPRISDAVRRAVFENNNFYIMLAAVIQVGEDLNLDEFSKGVLRDWVENIAHVSRPFNPDDPVI